MKRKLPVVILCALIAFVCAFTLSACEGIEFRVNFIVDGAVYDTVSTNGNENIRMPDDPTKDGFTFEGWYLDKDEWEQPFTSESLANETLTINLKVYAKWKPITPDDNPQTHTHAFPLEHYEAKAETCTEDGNVEYWQCSECNKYYSDEYATTEIDNIVIKASHKYGTWIQEVPATCIDDGTKGYYHCDVCGKNYDAEHNEIYDLTIKASGHKYTQEVATEDYLVSAATCTQKAKYYKSCVCGEKGTETFEYGKLGHDYGDDKICTKCGSEFCSEGLLYELNESGTAYSVIGVGTCTDTDIVIPSTYNDKPVTSIGEKAFYDCSSLTSVTIGNRVTSIGEMAFSGCTGLTSIIIPNNVTSIGSSAFEDCVGLTAVYYTGTIDQWVEIEFGGNPLYSAKKLYINNALVTEADITTATKISDYAFYGYESLTSVTIGNGVTSIGGSAFEDCWNLTSVTIGNSVTSIGEKAFYFCTSLTSITIPDSVTSIGSNAFRSCTGLTSITIGNSVTSIGDYAFEDCSKLTSVTIGNSVKSIGSYAFRSCTSLTSITIPGSVTNIGDYAFAYCSKLTSVTISNSVTSIGSYAFRSCTGLTSVTIPNSVTSIGSCVFSSCSSLKELTIPFVGNRAGVSSTDTYQYPLGYWFGTSSFTVGRETKQYYYGDSTSSTTSSIFYIPASLKKVTVTGGYIPYGAFYNCSNIKAIVLGDSVTSIGSDVFSGCSSLTSVTIGNGITSIDEKTFSGCSSLTSVTIGNGVTSIGEKTFSGCENLKSVTIGNGVTSIGEKAFYGCRWLTSIYYNATSCDDLSYKNNIFYFAGQNGDGITVTIGSNVTKIPAYLFSLDDSSYAHNITSVVFEENSRCTSIGNWAFSGCTSLTSITIPDSVTSIGYNAFYGCSSLTSVTIGNGVTSIGSSAFWDCSSLTSVTIGNSVTSIGGMAFYNCTGLTSITIGNSVTSIGSSAFSGCTSLTSIYYNATSCNDLKYNYVFHNAGQNGDGITVTIGSNVTKIPAYLFSLDSSYAHNITSVEFEENSRCTSIGSYAFYGCTGLISITIPDSVTSIDNRAFSGCTGLTSITIGNGVTSIGKYAFENCTGLTSITIPDSVTSIGSDAFRDCTGLTSIYYNATNCADLSSGNSAFSNAGQDGTGITVIIGNNVTKIPAYLFNLYDSSSAPKIMSVEFEENSKCTSIGSYAFRNCTGLTSLTIPDSVMSIGEDAFYYCSGLTSITIGNSVTSIGISAFYYCNSLTAVYYTGTIDQWVEIEFDGYNANPLSYAENLFINNKLATEVNITTATKINDYAFANCDSLTSVTIDNSVTSIGEKAFYGCDSLTSITIGSGVTSIGEKSFDACYKLTSITVDENNKYYFSVDGILYNKARTEFIHIPHAISGSITIPDPITSIGDYAFYNCRGLTGVGIRNNVASITSIGKYAFYGCSSLTGITIPDSVKSMGDWAFEDCTGLSAVYYIGTIDQWVQIEFSNYYANPLYYAQNLHANNELITEANITTATKISKYAFYNCSSLTSVTIGNSVMSIGSSAFSGCTGLTSVTIGNSVMSIGSSAFSGCTGLTSITIPDSVTSIGSWSFYNCTSLTSVTIGNSVTSIGEYAFKGCSSLTAVYYTGTIDQWAGIEFDGSYSNPLRYAKKLYINNELVTEANITKTTKLGDYVFYGCSSLTSVTIGNGVTSIGYDAFRYCESLTSITIPDSVTSIDSYAFSGCNALIAVYYTGTIDQWVEIEFGNYYYANPLYYAKNLYINNELVTEANITTATKISKYAFYGCISLTSVTIPDSVTSIGISAFSDCDGLTAVYYTGTIDQWVGIEFSGNPLRYAKELYINNELVTEANITTATKIGDYAFYGYKSLTSVKIGNSVTSIGKYAFSDCWNLTSITIPDSVTSIGKYAFSDCWNLTSITIPDSVTSIGGSAFYNCIGLTSIYYNATNCDDLSYKNNIFYFAGRNRDGITVTIGSNVTKIPAYLFNPYDSSSAPKIMSVEFEENSKCTSIGSYTFVYCSKLTSIAIPNSVTSIGYDAFYNCSSLTSITIGNSVTSIGKFAFNNCSSLEKVYYKGTATEWNNISIGSSNSYLTSATRYYYSESNPFEGENAVTSGNYWHYGSDGKTILVWEKQS